jgi:hypothetical protein
MNASTIEIETVAELQTLRKVRLSKAWRGLA